MIERKIIIGLIVSTEYCKKVKNIFNPNLLESVAARRLAMWAWEYFEKFNAAPGKEIETIYFSKLKDSRLSKDIAEEIEQEILPDLSEEYVKEGINVEFLIDETVKYFNSQYISNFTDDIQNLLAAGELEKAEHLVRQFRPLGGNDKIDEHIKTVNQIRKIDRPKPITFMKPWLKAGQLTIIYGQYGSGKSLLTIAIAYLLGLKDYTSEEAEMGEWQVKNPTGCLYIDGELGELEMEERVKSFEWIGKQSKRLRIFSVPEYQLATEDSFYLSKSTNQRVIIQWLREHPDYKLIVLDSASTLFGLEEENNNSEWNNKVNPFLRDLRALDVACILLHHAGKDSKRGLRGASAMGAMAHNIFRLSNHEKKSIDDGEAWFVITKDKQRSGGKGFKTFSLKFNLDEDGETHWEITDNF